MDRQYTFHFLDPATSIPPFHQNDLMELEIHAEALKWLDAWPNTFLTCNNVAHVVFPHAMILCAPEGCGKTHLATYWAKQNDAVFLSSADIKDILDEPLPAMLHFVVEDIHLIKDEILLFHFFNVIKEMKSYVLFTSRNTPSALSFVLPDLRSRVSAIPVITIPEPDDEFLFYITGKFFRQRQLNIADDVIHYLLCRVQRSIRSVKTVISILDAASLIEQRAITVPFVRDVLARHHASYIPPDTLEDNFKMAL